MNRKSLCRWIPFRLALVVAPLMAAWPQRAHAADIFWDRGSATNAWGTGGNWSATNAAPGTSGAVPAVGDVAVFNVTALTAAQTVEMGGARTILGMRFESVGTVLINGGAAAQTLSLGASGLTRSATAGAVTIGSTTAATNVSIALTANQTWTNNNAAGEVSVFNNITGAFNLNYAGAGTFRLGGTSNASTPALSSYTGTTNIGSGTTVIVNGSGAFGSTVGATTVASGGTINLGGTLAANGLNTGAEVFNVSGTGVGGLGAIISTATNSQQNAIQGTVNLLGNTTFGGSTRWDIRNGILNGGGGANVLTKVGTNTVFLSGNGRVGTSFDSLVIRQGGFTVETGAVLTASNVTNATAAINLAPLTAVQAAFTSWGNIVDHSASVTMDSSFAGSSTRLEVQNGNTIHSGNLAVLGTTNRLDADPNFALTLGGVISGAGNLEKVDTGALYINNNSNTQSGTFTVTAGSLGGNGNLASSSVTMAAGTTLSPGSGVFNAGTLTIDNALINNGATTAFFNLGTSSDKVNATTLTQNGTTSIFVVNGPGAGPGTYTLFDYGTLGGSTGFAGYSLGAAHVDGALVNTGSSIDLTLNSANPLVWKGSSNRFWTSINIGSATPQYNALTNPALTNFGWTPDANNSVEFVNQDNVLFDDTNTGTTNVLVSTTVTPGSLVFNNSSLNYTLDTAPFTFAGGNVAGGSGIEKNGTGTTTLLGTMNFSGDINVNAGILQLGNDSRVALFRLGSTADTPGMGPNINIAGGAALAVANGVNGANIHNNNISGAGAIVLNASQQDNYFNFLADRGDVRFNGSLAGFTGDITIMDGNRLQVTAAQNVGGANGITVQDGGAFFPVGAFDVATPLSISGKGWSETGGKLGAIRLANAATLSGPITMTGNSRITAFNSTGGISGLISGAYNLELGFNHTGTSSGTLNLTNPTNTYSGDTTITRMTINAETLANAGVASSLGMGDELLIDASNLNILGAGPMTSDRNITLGTMGIGGSTIGVINASNTLTLMGTINNALPVAASGSAFRPLLNFLQTQTTGTGGTLVLNTASPIITSGTTVHRQNLTLAGNTNFTVGASGFGSAGTFNLGMSTSADQGGATLNIQDNAVLTVYGEFDVGNQGVAQSYVVNQSGNSVVNALRGGGVGADAVNATNIINRGMRLGHWGAENTTYNLTGGTLNVPNGHLWVGFDGGATFNQSIGTTVNAIGLRMVNNTTLPAVYNLNGGQLNIGAFGFAKGGSTGTGTAVPALNLNGGTYRATANHGISSNIAINVQNGGGTIDTNGFTVSSLSRLIGVGNGAFTKAGAGELVLPAGNNDFIGATNITGGTLTLGSAGSLITASSLVTVGNGGNLAGLGGVSAVGGVSVASGGSISPGLSAGAGLGALTLSTLSTDSGSILNLSPGATTDRINVTNAYNPAAGSMLNVLPVGNLATGTYVLVDYGTIGGGGLAGMVASIPHFTVAGTAINDSGSTLDLVVPAGAVLDTMVWTGTGGANWDNNVTANTFNSTANPGVAFINGDRALFDDTSSVGSIAVASGGITPADVAFNNSTTAYTLTGGSITGGTALTKDGTATTILANNNTYTGVTTITAGTLQVGNGGATGSLGLGDTVNNATLSFNRSLTSSYNGVISGTGVVRSDGTGMTTLGALVATPVANTYSGGTVISKGTLQGNHNSFGTGVITLNDAATGSGNTALLIQNGAASTIANNIVVANFGSGTATIGSSEDSQVGSGLLFSGTLTLDRPTRLLGEFDRTTFANIISGNVGTLTIGRSAGLEDFEMGRVVLEKDNTFTGNVFVEGFTNLQLNDISNTPVNTAKNQLPDTASVTLGDTSFLTLADSGTADDSETIGDLISSFSTSRVRSLSTGSILTVGTANDATFNGVVDGGNSFNVIKVGTGTQTFGGTLDNVGGRIQVDAGTVILAKDSSNVVHAAGSALIINTGGTLKLGGTYTAFRGDDTNRDSASQYQLNAPANFVDQIYNNIDVTLNTGGVLDLNGKSEVINGLVGSGGMLTNNGAVAGTLYLGAANSGGTFPGVIQDGTSVVNIAKGGTSAMTFGGTNTYTGTTHINAGSLVITNVAGLGSPSGGTIVTGNREALASLTISVPTASDPTAPNIIAEPIVLISELSGDQRAQIINTVESTRLTGPITVSGDGLFQINAAQAAGDQFQINGGITGSSNGSLFLRGNNELQLNSLITAPNIVVSKTDPGLLVLNVSGHDYKEINLVHGTVRADVANALDTGAILRMGQGGNANTFNMNGFNQQVAGLLSNPSVLDVFARTITSATPATLTINTPSVNGGDYLFVGNITGSVSLTKSGSGAQVLGTPLSGVNDFAGGVIINEGTLRLANANLIPDGAGKGNVTVGTGGGIAQFDLNGNAETINGLHGSSDGIVSSNGAGNATLTVNGTTTPATDANFSGVIQNRTDGGTGTLGLTKVGATTTQMLSGANTYTGATNIVGGTLLMGADDVLPDDSALSLSAGTTLGTGGFSDTTGALSFNGDATFDMGAGSSSVLTFSSVTAWTGILNVWNYNGAIWTSGMDQLVFSSGSGLVNLSNVQFYSDGGVTPIGVGSTFLGSELVPVPEASSVFTALLLLAGIGYRERRSFLHYRK